MSAQRRRRSRGRRLGLFGMAPQLEASKVDALSKAAVATLANGAVGITTLCCYGNDSSEIGRCPYLLEVEKAHSRCFYGVSVCNITSYLRDELGKKWICPELSPVVGSLLKWAVNRVPSK